MRTVILHYHIYKNSGTSFDQVLAHNFSDRHELFDGPYPFFVIDQEQVDRIIMRRPAAIAFSSHQMSLPQPSSISYQVLAAAFMRNPFLRIASIYRFKRGEMLAQQDVSADTTTTAVAARELDFAGWIEHCLGDKSEIGNVSNAQTRFFACAYRLRPQLKRTPSGMVYDLRTALRTLAGVELLGRTEHFEQDVRRMGDILAGHDIAFVLPPDTRHNVTQQSERSVEDRVADLLDQLPPNLRARLVAANQQDLAMYDRACELIERDHRP